MLVQSLQAAQHARGDGVVVYPAMVKTQEARSGDGPMMKRVLVGDDHPAVPLALRVAFRLDGRFAVADSAATGAEGLEKLGGQDAVLLDLHLPDMVGADMVEAFRQRSAGVPLILHSAAESTPDVEE